MLAVSVRTGRVEWTAVIDPDRESTVYGPRAYDAFCEFAEGQAAAPGA